MDTLIRSLRVSDQAVLLDIRRPSKSVESAPKDAPLAQWVREPAGNSRDGKDPGRGDAGPNRDVAAVVPPVETAQAASPAHDAAWLETQRKEIEEELRVEMAARLESLAEEARSRGHEAGIELGKAEVLRETQEQRAAVKRALAAVAQGLEREVQGAHDLIVGIAFESICKLLGSKAADRDTMISMVHDVLQRVKQDEAVLVRMHPRDCAVLHDLADAADFGDDRRLKVELVADEKIALGGCLVETGGGLLDARIETQMEKLRETLLKARRGAEHGEGRQS